MLSLYKLLVSICIRICIRIRILILVDIFLLNIKQYLLFLLLRVVDKTRLLFVLFTKICFFKFDATLYNFSITKINIKRMISEIPTNLPAISNFHFINADILYWCNLIMVNELRNLKLQPLFFLFKKTKQQRALVICELIIDKTL